VEEENDGRTHSLNCSTVHSELNSFVLCSGSDPIISSGSKVFRVHVCIFKATLYRAVLCSLYLHYCEISFEQS